MKAPALYIYFQFKIAEHANKKEMTRDKVIDLLSYYNLPKSLRGHIISEMQGFGLLEEGIDKIKVINCNILSELSYKSNITRRRKMEQRVLRC